MTVNRRLTPILATGGVAVVVALTLIVAKLTGWFAVSAAPAPVGQSVTASEPSATLSTTASATAPPTSPSAAATAGGAGTNGGGTGGGGTGGGTAHPSPTTSAPTPTPSTMQVVNDYEVFGWSSTCSWVENAAGLTITLPITVHHIGVNGQSYVNLTLTADGTVTHAGSQLDLGGKIAASTGQFRGDLPRLLRITVVIANAATLGDTNAANDSVDFNVGLPAKSGNSNGSTPCTPSRLEPS